MKEDGDLLRGIVEADATYLGGKTRGDMERSRKRKVGIGHRGARRHGQGFTLASCHRQVLINMFLRKNVDPRSILMTDQWPGYDEVRDWMQYLNVNHSKTYADGIIQTNTTEIFRSMVKRAIIGQHHHYTIEHAEMYIDEAVGVG